ncbi:MAG: Transcriptional regulator, XRE family [Candidatus Amesbacteria bacterium GW2011_GWA2_42_12]|uniref:Transcriptional regulator, XRE family n=1 Tax=Candidatus Amesbacteria bacterium GW2011_GWA2_42_12 TaxID=1618356 RepID=A0A0G0Y8V0_9BACT|nr:MAG: Transcriptional regulator, XRE family [Candidatus Amesbacteria bacterium GW2011_GWA2_42_12]
MKNVTWKDFRKELLADPEVAKEVKRLEPEYQLANSLITTRIKRRLTQAQLAKKAKTNQASISRLEWASSKPSLSLLRKIASALDANLITRFEI